MALITGTPSGRRGREAATGGGGAGGGGNGPPGPPSGGRPPGGGPPNDPPRTLQQLDRDVYDIQRGLIREFNGMIGDFNQRDDTRLEQWEATTGNFEQAMRTHVSLGILFSSFTRTYCSKGQHSYDSVHRCWKSSDDSD